jgi:two-component system repressor protein LuxO
MKTATNPLPHILIIEDTKSLGEMYAYALRQSGFCADHFLRGEDGMEFLSARHATMPDLLLLDIKLPDCNGLDLLVRVRSEYPALPIIIMTGHASINTAVDAIRQGAREFLVKPFAPERLLDAVKKTLSTHGVTHDNSLQDSAPKPTENLEPLFKQSPEQAPSQEPPARNFGGFIGTSKVMQMIYEQIEQAAKSDATVFITGESGTGKEVCAEAIHKYSARKDKPFIALNCAAIPRDLIESELFGHIKGAFTGAIADRIGAASMADGGTLFLDEIGEMTPAMQTKLLRFLQDYSFQKVGGDKRETVDIRIICATNREPLREIAAGRFREDLFYRLYVLPLQMPALRGRSDDIIDIADTFLRQYARAEAKPFEAFTEDAETRLRAYQWPGNVRQLQNVVRHVVVMNNGRLATAQMLPPDLLHQNLQPSQTPPIMTDSHHTSSHQPPYNQAPLQSDNDQHFCFQTKAQIRPLHEIERAIIQSAIALHGGNIPQAAAALNIAPSTIYRKKVSWDIEAV